MCNVAWPSGPAVILVLSTTFCLYSEFCPDPEESRKHRHLRKISFTDKKKPFFSNRSFQCHLNWLSRSPYVIHCLEVVTYPRTSNRQAYGHRGNVWSEICLQAFSERESQRTLSGPKQASKHVQTSGSIMRLIPKTLWTEMGALGTIIFSWQNCSWIL